MASLCQLESGLHQAVSATYAVVPGIASFARLAEALGHS